MALTIPAVPFPEYGDCPAKQYIDELKRLVSPNIFMTEYMDAKSRRPY
jgi:hypothetical protein